MSVFSCGSPDTGRSLHDCDAPPGGQAGSGCKNRVAAREGRCDALYVLYQLLARHPCVSSGIRADIRNTGEALYHCVHRRPVAA